MTHREICCVSLIAILLTAAPAVLPADEKDSAATQIGSSVEPSDWARYNYDTSGSRHNPAESTLSSENITRLELKWRFPPDGDVIGRDL